MFTLRMLNAAMAAILFTAAPSAMALGVSSTESAKLSSSYSTWAGGKSNSDSLVAGLRASSTISLSTTSANGTVSTATFTPSTKPMGYGNVNLSLALAKRSLASLGITSPTAEQMQAALMGGTVTLPNGTTTTVKGVVALRASGLGWGQIAKQYNTSLGGVVSKGKASNTTTAMSGVNANAHTGGSGITTGASGAAFGQSQGNSQSAPGIVNAPGGSFGAAGPGNSAFGQSQGGGKGKGG